MKYIRTKDGRIVDTEKEYQELDWAREARDYALTEKEADTIDELCDEFVAEELFVETNYIAHINKSVSVEKKLDYFVNYFIESNKVTKDKLLNVYGAIWTDKGLIYVAKMNEKGCLELL